MNITAPEVAALVLAVAACLFDVRTRRIPNVLTLGGAGLAIGYFWLSNGSAAAMSALTGWGVGLAIFFPFFWLRGMGAGDVKLLAALGAWTGAGQVLWVALYGAVAGGALAVIVLLKSRYLGAAVANLRLLGQYWWRVGLGPVPTITLSDAAGPRLPYALPIAAGLVVTLWLR